ncbi:MAG: hypothetical protein MOGDAGHF_02225 [Rhodocyclaceae bacterium]|nr:hypothetical protein [Rhodocyclaceae bacterium]
MHEAAAVQAAGDVGDLGGDAVPPGLTFEARVVAAGELAQIGRIRNFRRDQRPAHEAAALAFEAVGDEPRGGNAPVGEALQVLPLQLYARRAEPAPQRLLAEAMVALDVVAAAIDFDAHRAGGGVLGDDLALEGEDGVEVGEARGGRGVHPGQDPPLAHEPFPRPPSRGRG